MLRCFCERISRVVICGGTAIAGGAPTATAVATTSPYPSLSSALLPLHRALATVASTTPAAPRGVCDGGGGTTVAPGPYRRVGHVFIVTCNDHPFKFSWEVNRTLRDLRLEFMGQTTIVPDIPQVRKQLWRVRHIVRVDHLDLDEAKALVGVPEHVSFRDLAAQISPTFGRGGSVQNPHMRSKMNFMRLRRMRLRDVMHRDQLEKKLLEERRRALLSQSTEPSAPSGEAA